MNTAVTVTAIICLTLVVLTLLQKIDNIKK